MTFLRLSKAASHGPAAQGSQEGAGSPTFDCVKWLAICCSAWMSLSPWNELRVYLCAQARAQPPLPSPSPSPSAQHTAQSTQRAAHGAHSCAVMGAIVKSVARVRANLGPSLSHVTYVHSFVIFRECRTHSIHYKIDDPLIYIHVLTFVCVCVGVRVQSQAKSSFRSLIKVKTVTRCDSASKQKTSGLRRKCVRGKWRCST